MIVVKLELSMNMLNLVDHTESDGVVLDPAFPFPLKINNLR